MPYEPTAVTWMTLLGACQVHDDIERGTRAAEHVFQLDPTIAGSYVSLSNIYAAAGRWDCVAMVRKGMDNKGVKKQPGCSWIEVQDKVHRFNVGGTMHPQLEEILTELQKLSKQMEDLGYVPHTTMALHDIGEAEEEHIACYHSEKLAI
eukprot:c25216_g13_i1 orf=2-448(+)